MLTLGQLGEFVAKHHTRDLFRLETLPSYKTATMTTSAGTCEVSRHRPQRRSSRGWTGSGPMSPQAGLGAVSTQSPTRWRTISATSANGATC